MLIWRLTSQHDGILLRLVADVNEGYTYYRLVGVKKKFMGAGPVCFCTTGQVQCKCKRFLCSRPRFCDLRDTYEHESKSLSLKAGDYYLQTDLHSLRPV